MTGLFLGTVFSFASMSADSAAFSLSAPGQQVTGTLKLDRIELNGPFQLPFRIPEKFLPME